jgi:hypothetical protein
MIWPTLCIDNFFPNLNEIIKFCKTLSYAPANNGEWPGERTKKIHLIDPDFFNYSTSKMIASLYPNDWRNMSWSAVSSFQKIKGSWQEEGWVHQDVTEISCIIYLDGDENCGTSLFKQITHQSIDIKRQGIRKDGNLDSDKIKTKEYKEARKKSNQRFKKTISFDSIPNRCIMFDSSQYHAVNNYNNSKQGERLTLVTFFDSIKRNDGQQLKYHTIEAKRI